MLSEKVKALGVPKRIGPAEVFDEVDAGDDVVD